MGYDFEGLKIKAAESSEFFSSFVFFFLEVTKYYLTGLIIGFFVYMTFLNYSRIPVWNHIISPLPPIANEQEHVNDPCCPLDISESQIRTKNDRPSILQRAEKKKKKEKCIDSQNSSKDKLYQVFLAAKETNDSASGYRSQNEKPTRSVKYMKAMDLKIVEESKRKLDHSSSTTDLRESSNERSYTTYSEERSYRTFTTEQSNLPYPPAQKVVVSRVEKDPEEPKMFKCPDGGVVVVISISDKNVCTSDNQEPARPQEKPNVKCNVDTSTTELSRYFMKVLVGEAQKQAHKSCSTSDASQNDNNEEPNQTITESPLPNKASICTCNHRQPPEEVEDKSNLTDTKSSETKKSQKKGKEGKKNVGHAVFSKDYCGPGTDEQKKKKSSRGAQLKIDDKTYYLAEIYGEKSSTSGLSGTVDKEQKELFETEKDSSDEDISTGSESCSDDENLVVSINHKNKSEEEINDSVEENKNFRRQMVKLFNQKFKKEKRSKSK